MSGKEDPSVIKPAVDTTVDTTAAGLVTGADAALGGVETGAYTTDAALIG